LQTLPQGEHAFAPGTASDFFFPTSTVLLSSLFRNVVMVSWSFSFLINLLEGSFFPVSVFLLIPVFNFASRRTCLCSRHQNIALKLKAMRALGLNVSKRPDTFIKEHDTNEKLREAIEPKLPDNDVRSHLCALHQTSSFQLALYYCPLYSGMWWWSPEVFPFWSIF
jgi:hypothetical protein